MTKPKDDQRPVTQKEPPKLCWRELLQGSFDGPTWGDHTLEAYLDRLERPS